MTHLVTSPTAYPPSTHQATGAMSCRRMQVLETTSISSAYRLFFFTNCEGQCYIEKEHPVALLGQDVLLCPPNQQLNFIAATERPCEYVLLTFQAESLLQSNGKLSLPAYLWHLPTPTKEMQSCIEKLEQMVGVSTDERILLTRLTLTELCLYIHLQNEKTIENDSNMPLASKVMQYVNEHLTSPISLDEIAKHFFVSKYYLCRSFKSVYGTSLHHFWNRRRVELACQLISEGKTASAAAYHVGFIDYSTFYRAYKKHLGHAPTESAEP